MKLMAVFSWRTLAEESADADVLREVIGFAAQRLMELEVAGVTGAVHDEGDGTGRMILRGAGGTLEPASFRVGIMRSHSRDGPKRSR